MTVSSLWITLVGSLVDIPVAMMTALDLPRPCFIQPVVFDGSVHLDSAIFSLLTRLSGKCY